MLQISAAEAASVFLPRDELLIYGDQKKKSN